MMFTDSRINSTSFYKGFVAKIILTDLPNSTWHVVDLMMIDTNCDDNININFGHGDAFMCSFVPTAWIQNFQPNVTKKVRRILDATTGIESWESIHDHQL